MMADISNYFYRRKGLAVSLVASGQHLCGAIWPFLIKDFLIDGDWRKRAPFHCGSMQCVNTNFILSFR